MVSLAYIDDICNKFQYFSLSLHMWLYYNIKDCNVYIFLITILGVCKSITDEIDRNNKANVEMESNCQEITVLPTSRGKFD